MPVFDPLPDSAWHRALSGGRGTLTDADLNPPPLSHSTTPACSFRPMGAGLKDRSTGSVPSSSLFHIGTYLSNMKYLRTVHRRKFLTPGKVGLVDGNRFVGGWICSFVFNRETRRKFFHVKISCFTVLQGVEWGKRIGWPGWGPWWPDVCYHSRIVNL